MAAPKFAPVLADRRRPRGTSRPTIVPGSWMPDRPGRDRAASSPSGDRLGYQGPDQGFAIKIANTFRPPHAA